LDIVSDEALLGGVKPQFIVEVSDASARYTTDGQRSSVDAFASAWRNAAIYTSSATTATFVATAILTFFAAMIRAWLSVPVLIIGIVLFAWTSARAANKRRVRIGYRLDPSAQKAFESMSHGVGWLTNSRAVWRVTHEELARRPANTTSVTRTPARIARERVANLLTNVTVSSIDAGGETIVFLPDSLFVRRHAGTIEDVPYTFIRVEVETTQFSESGHVPNDCERVGASWLYANKDGSPDRRRGHNPQIPILEYARVTLSWRSSGCVFLVSSVDAARHFATALQTMAMSQTAKPVEPPRKAVTMAEETKMPAQIPIGSNDLERALQNSIDRKKRLDELERQSAAVHAAPVETKPVKTNAEWLGANGTTNVHGFETGPFVYAGNRLQALDGSRVEPALIDPALPVDPSYANVHGEKITYWPSYDSITAASRRAFLQWLAGGRKDPNAYIGYVFIFFYGLERRVAQSIQEKRSDADELLAIGREVARLLDVYADSSSSFAGYASSFLDLLAAIEPRLRELSRDRPPHEDGVSQSVRMTLGEHALAEKPIPAEVALAWVSSTRILNTPAVRCANEFELLFHIRYAKKFGDGLVVKANSTSIELTYRPASATIDPIVVKRAVPDVSVIARPLAQLIALIDECSSALDSFSRFLGKNENGRESLAAFALLPEELVEATPSADASALASLVRSRLDEDGRAHLAAGELLQHVRLAKPGKVSKNEAMLLAQALEKLGYGIEPDVRLGGPVYDVEGRVVVFRRLPDCPSVASDEYATASLLVRLGAMVSAADDAVSKSERELLEQHIEERLQLTAGERQRLAAHLAWLIEAGLGMTGLKRRLESLPQHARHAIGKVLIDIAATDGQVDAREMKMLEKLYGLLGLEPGDLYRDVHAVQARDEEPVPVDQPAPVKGFAIPPKPAATVASPTSTIDMDRVRQKIAETREVSSLLSSIFVEEQAPVAVAPAIAQANTIGPLDAAHSELLRRLAERESWPRDEVERLAGELSLLPDGALETINDYAYATADEPLWEDDDPVAINSRVAMELIA
jgi:uncharacterized tellurite resistance protein B-like protein